MVNATMLQLDKETRSQEIVKSLRGFLKHQTERVSLYKEFNDAFKEYMAKRMTPEEYATICRIVTEGFVELSIEILALEAHLGGSPPAATTTAAAPTSAMSDNTTATLTGTPPEPAPSTSASSSQLSLNSPEHAQLIRQVQLLERQKLALTVQGQKWVLEKETAEVKDQETRLALEQADRVVDLERREEDREDEVRQTAVQETESSKAGSNGVAGQLSVGELEAMLKENRASLSQVVEDINERLADIQEAIAVIVL